MEIAGPNKLVGDIESNEVVANQINAVNLNVDETIKTKYLEIGNNYGMITKTFVGNDSYSLTSGKPKKGVLLTIDTEALAPTLNSSGNIVGGDTGMFSLIVNIHQPYKGNTSINVYGYLSEGDADGVVRSGYKVLSLSEYIDDVSSVTMYVTQGLSANLELDNSGAADAYGISQNKSYIFIEFKQNSAFLFYYSTITVELATPPGSFSQLPIKDYIDVDLYSDASWNAIPTEAGFTNFDQIYKLHTISNAPCTYTKLRADYTMGAATGKNWDTDFLIRFLLNNIDVIVIPLNLSEGELIQHYAKTANRVTFAVSLGIPVVATPIPTYELIIENGVNGFLVNDPEDWKKSLSLLRTSFQRDSIGKHSSFEIRKKYHVNNIIKDWIKVFES